MERVNDSGRCEACPLALFCTPDMWLMLLDMRFESQFGPPEGPLPEDPDAADEVVMGIVKAQDPVAAV